MSICSIAADQWKDWLKSQLQYKDAFADRKREQNILDFTDMEHFALDILMHKEGDTITPSAAAWELSARYDEVMVDEYQDSKSGTGDDHDLVAGWADKRKNIFMVGDVKPEYLSFPSGTTGAFYGKIPQVFTGRQRGTENRSAQKTSEAVERYYHLSTICFRQIMVRILAGSLMRMKMHFITGASFPERAVW